MGLSLEQRIDRLEARAEIGELCSAYGIACDEHDYDRLESLFTADVRIQSRDGLMDATGRDVVMAMFGRMFAIRGPAFHWTHDRFVTFNDTAPGTATGLVLAHAETSPDGIASIAAIRYKDRYRYEDGRWKFAERQLSFLYYMPVTEFAEHFPTEQRMGLGGTWRAADFPEGLSSYRKPRG